MDRDKQFEKYTLREMASGATGCGEGLQTPSESEEFSLSLFFFFSFICHST